MPNIINIRCEKVHGENGQLAFQIKYSVDKSRIRDGQIEVRITDEDAGNDVIYQKQYRQGAFQINDTLFERDLRNRMGHLLCVRLLIDGEETEQNYAFAGEKTVISYNAVIDRNNQVLRYTFINTSRDRDVSFMPDDLRISLKTLNGEKKFDLPFPPFELLRGRSASFVIPVAPDLTLDDLIFDKNIQARFDFQKFN